MRLPMNERSLLWLTAVGFFMQTLDSTIVNTALPAMAASLGESPLRMQSVVVAYTLAMAILIPISGWVADRFGTRRVYFAAMVLFTIGSFLCSISHSLSQLVAARVLQGFGGAMLLPVGRLAVLKSIPRERFLSAMAFVTIPALVGPLVGPTLGGWLVQTASWPWIFLINIPIGILGALATLRYMPDHRVDEVRALDHSGFFLLAFSMAAISFALEGLAELGLRGATVLVLLIFGLAALAAFWLHTLKNPEPLFSRTLFAIDSFRIGLIGNLFARIGSGAMPFLLPLTLQIGMHRTPLQAGLLMIPTAIAGMLSKRVGTSIIERFGYRRVLLTNTVLVGASIASFVYLSQDQPVWVRITQLLIFGAVNSLQFTAMNTVALKDLDRSQASEGNSLLTVVQMLSMSLGVAGAGGILQMFTSHLDEAQAGDLMPAFHATFVCVGLITLACACIFWQLEPDVRGEKRAREGRYSQVWSNLSE